MPKPTRNPKPREFSDLLCAHYPKRHLKGSQAESVCAKREQDRADKGHAAGKSFFERVIENGGEIAPGVYLSL